MILLHWYTLKHAALCFLCHLYGDGINTFKDIHICCSSNLSSTKKKFFETYFSDKKKLLEYPGFQHAWNSSLPFYLDNLIWIKQSRKAGWCTSKFPLFDLLYSHLWCTLVVLGIVRGDGVKLTLPVCMAHHLSQIYWSLSPEIAVLVCAMLYTPVNLLLGTHVYGCKLPAHCFHRGAWS